MRFTPVEALLAWGLLAIPVCHLTGRRLRHTQPPDIDLDGTWRRTTTRGGEARSCWADIRARDGGESDG